MDNQSNFSQAIISTPIILTSSVSIDMRATMNAQNSDDALDLKCYIHEKNRNIHSGKISSGFAFVSHKIH